MSDPNETEVTLALSGAGALAAAAERLIRVRGYGPDRCLLLLGVTGANSATRQARRQALAVARSHGGLSTGALLGEQWR
ncbi:MAG: FAD-binding oxidoreductase, partial [Xanthomonadales bacterium]|nr:FAD-binding oxidoreductase [Xanthomonadales bacterium]